jgi:tetratricopeptide (TPR) repeat protein
MALYGLLVILFFTLQDDIRATLSRAETLYYEARFKESIQLLLRVDESLQSKPDRASDRISVKLQLALGYVGMNDNAQAKDLLRAVYALDPDYVLDTQQFPPKVLALAGEAKAEQQQILCQAVREDARRKLDTANAEALLVLLGSMKSRCDGLAVFEAGTADLFYKTGLESYRGGAFSDAQNRFRTALKLFPKHELASQYLELTESKLEVATDRLALQWRKDFEAREFAAAALLYRQLKSSAPSQMDAVNAEYRETLSSLVDAWNRACAMADAAQKESVRVQISQLLPEPSFGADILARMSNCAPAGCIQMTSPLALTRLKVRVNPDIPPAALDFVRRSQPTVRASVRIDEQGNTVVNGIEGANMLVNNAVRVAVEQWKFSPAIDPSGPRCVEADILIAINSNL